MRKFAFYHLWVNNDYIRVHNQIFSKIISNPFFDDVIFFFTVVPGNQEFEQDRLIMPRGEYYIVDYENTGSEWPSIITMYKKNIEYKFDKNDVIFYFHCKSVSYAQNRWDDNLMNTLHGKISQYQWLDCLSFLLIEKIQEYMDDLKKHGSLCVFSIHKVLNFYSNCTTAGTQGNWWWVTGDVLSQVSKFENILENDKCKERRLYAELVFLADLLQSSDREYKNGYFIHDGITPPLYLNNINSNSSWVEMGIGYFNRDFIPLNNPDFPYVDSLSASIGITVLNVDDEDDFFETCDKFISIQRFKNFWIQADRTLDKDKLKQWGNIHKNIVINKILISCISY